MHKLYFVPLSLVLNTPYTTKRKYNSFLIIFHFIYFFCLPPLILLFINHVCLSKICLYKLIIACVTNMRALKCNYNYENNNNEIYIKMCANVKCIPAHYKLYMIKAELEGNCEYFGIF